MVLAHPVVIGLELMRGHYLDLGVLARFVVDLSVQRYLVSIGHG